MIKEPSTKIKNVIDKIHGQKIIDPYRWLEDNSKEVDNWIKKQNIYSKSFLGNIKQREQIRSRLKTIFSVDTFGTPVPRGQRYFYMQRKSNQELSALYYQDGLSGKPKVLIDGNKLSKDKTTVIFSWHPSPDGSLLVYSLSEQANDQASIYVLDVESGKKLDDQIPADIYPYFSEWDLDNRGFWYVKRKDGTPKGEEKFHKKLYYHKLGSNYKDDPLIFGENIAKEDVPSAEVSKDGRFLLVTTYISSDKIERTEIHIKDLSDPKSEFVHLTEGTKGLFYPLFHHGSIYAMTNYKTPKWKVIKASFEELTRNVKLWETIIAESNDTIDSYLTVGDRLFVHFIKDANSVFEAYSLEGKHLKSLELPTMGEIGMMRGEEDGSEIFFSFSSLFIPQTIYHYDLPGDKLDIFKKVKSSTNEKLYQLDQIWFKSKDGTRIPMYLAYKKGLKKTGNNPTLIYGYGGFNISLLPSYNTRTSAMIPFLEEGGLYAIPNLRGGGEFGEDWHLAGVKLKKQNVFDDFIASAEWLIKENYTNREKIAIFGWSNGGLLTSTSLTQRPDLYKSVIIGAPVIDMLRYHLFFGGRHWITDYGSVEDKEEFEYLLSYSPYHNLKEQSYPSTLILTTDKDDRVHPMHAFKFAARLQANNQSTNPILIRIETKAGHGGASSKSRSIDQFTDVLSFIFWQLGIK